MAIKQRTKSLKARASNLADTKYQLTILNQSHDTPSAIPPFASKLSAPLRPQKTTVLQLNLGRLCNQSCAHCHVDAGPDRTEVMPMAIMDKCLGLAVKHGIDTIDITGGAPEMTPGFRHLVTEAHRYGLTIMHRCNLTIIEANKKYHDLPEFFARHSVHVISSLPHFSKTRTDRQRGDGVFADSIRAMKRLNAVGYGVDEGLKLDLVYNPSGAFLPGDQQSLEADFKLQLKRRYDIVFNDLYCITNLPISRFLDYLITSGNYTQYMKTLHAHFNPATVDGLMCRHTLSVDWQGYLYDCDFNQMLNLRVNHGMQHIDDADLDALLARDIVVNQHCYGCTAGAGSSCGGEIM